MDITITINTDNAAFADDMHGETARILHGLAERFESHHLPVYLLDINGNKVGAVEFSGDEDEYYLDDIPAFLRRQAD